MVIPNFSYVAVKLSIPRVKLHILTYSRKKTVINKILDHSLSYFEAFLYPKVKNERHSSEKKASSKHFPGYVLLQTLLAVIP